MQQFAADVIAFMDAMQLKQATIVGHSMGSIVAQHVAAEAPERVSKLVLVGSATSVRNFAVGDLQREVNALPEAIPEKFAHDFQVSTTFNPLAPAFLQAVVKESQKMPGRVWREVVTEMLAPEGTAELKKVKTPTLILWGEKETFCPRSEQDALVSSLRNSTLKVYPDTGHALHWERPERFAQDLQEFINNGLPNGRLTESHHGGAQRR
jgi:pimeloyl-ACP methyl ester carboxylesterase